MKKDFRSKKVFITGIDGFTGQYLKNHLINNGFTVFGLGNFNEKNILNAKLEDTDSICEFLKLTQPNYIINLAGISFVGETDIDSFYRVNTIGAENLLKSIIESNIRVDKVLLISSATVYGNQINHVLSEDLVPNPNNHYGISKLAMEFIAKNYYDKLPIIIARPFNYSGLGHSENFVIPKIVKHFKEKKESIELGNIHTLREYNDIDWVCDIYLKLILSTFESDVVNIASGKTISVDDVIQLLIEYTGHDIKVNINPEFIRANEIHELKGSISKLSSIIDIVENSGFKENFKNYF